MHAISVMSRRDVLRTSGAVVVSFIFGAALSHRSLAQEPGAGTDLGKPLDPKEVDSFLAVHADGSVTIYTSRVDVGAGLRLAMSQMVAEELGVPVARISVVEGDTALTPDHGGTGGSTGIPRGAVEVRQAAATARQAILHLGAERLGRPAAELTLVDGQVRPATGGPGIVIGALVGGKRLALKIDPKAPLQDPTRYTVVGKPLLRPDVPGKCPGRHVYLQDFTVPGMLHGRVIRPPAIGATLLAVDESSLHGIPDVRVVRIESFLGVVAPDEWAAVRAARALKATWSAWQGLPGSAGLDRAVRESAVERTEAIVSRGDPVAALPAAATQLAATYTWPFQSHASLGPSCAVADVRPEGTTIWTASQNPYAIRRNLAKIFGIPEDKLRVIFLDSSGSYGANGGDDAAADALLLSKTMGRPVRVQWSRQDEHGWDPKGPPQVLEVRGGIDADQRITAWDTQMWLPANVQGHRPFLSVDAAGMSQAHGRGAGQTSQNGDPPYAASNVRVLVHWLKETPLRLAILRAPGKIANVFAVESFTDELAAAAGADPVAFRLRGLTDPRAIDVLQRATEMIGWQARPSPTPRPAQDNVLTGRGVAYVRYKHSENYVAMAMDVAVDPASGRIGVRRVTCAHDCGLVVNPDGLRNQIEGSILQTLSRTLHEEVTFDRSRVTSVDWVSYPILTFPEVPEIEVALLDKPTLPPFGAGGRRPGERHLRCHRGQAARRALHARPGQSGAHGTRRQWRPGAAHTGCTASVACQQRLEACTTSSRRWANNPVCEAHPMSAPLFHMIAGAPDPVAPFSHAVEQDGWVFVTGQLPFTGIANDSPYPEGIEAQTRQVLANLQRVLAGCGLGLEHVLAVRVFLTHFEDDYETMNLVYAEHFPPQRRPARTCVGVTALARGARIEIDLIARRP